MLYGCLVHVSETSTEKQILSCELHKNAFGGRAPSRPAGGAIALLQTPSHYKRMAGRGRKGLGIAGSGMEKRERFEG